MILNNASYYFLTYTIYFDKDLKNKADILINNLSNEELINSFFNESNSLTFIPTLIETNNWILIDKSNSKIKFCYQNNDFNEIIYNTFEINYKIVNNNYIINDFKIYNLGCECCLELFRYLLLDIKELDDSNTTFSTDSNIEKSFSMLFNDYICGDYYYLESYYHKDYNHSNLGTISKMSINIKDMYNKDLTICYKNIIDYDITDTPKNLCICKYDDDTGERIRNYRCRHSYLRHSGYEKLQNNFLFKVGILEGSQDIERI
jgi:hypothetical protein